MTLAKGGKSDTPQFDDDVFDAAAKKVYDNGSFDLSLFKDPKVRAVIEETFRVIDTAVGDGLPTEVPATLKYALENNAFIFSGLKTFHSLREVGLSMVKEDGNIKPFNDFKEDVGKINARYNHNYLYAEYNHALAASQMASKWADIEKDGDEYNLQYRTANDEKVREEHARLHGTTLPPSDPFWDKYYPPNGWNCRCTAVQVRKEKYPTSDPDEAMRAGDDCTSGDKRSIFRYNPGKSMILYPPKHPYYKVPKEAAEAIVELVPPDNTPKEVRDEEIPFREELGLNCALDGMKAENIKLIRSIFRSAKANMERFPKLRDNIQYIGTIAGRVRLLSEERYKVLKNLDPGGDELQMRKDAMDWAIKKGRVNKCYACVKDTPKDMNLSGICYNSFYDSERLAKSLTKAMLNQSTPIGCTTVKSIIDHEFGHLISDLIDLENNKEFIKIYGDARKQGKTYVTRNLSSYAYKNKKEFIAEAYSEYLNNEKPRRIANKVGKLIEKIYADKFPSESSSSSSSR